MLENARWAHARATQLTEELAQAEPSLDTVELFRKMITASCAVTARRLCLSRGGDACAVERAADALNRPGIDSKPFGYL
jgi:hypothetical protein